MRRPRSFHRQPFGPLRHGSGNRTTGASVVPPQRHPGANFGMLASVSSAMIRLQPKSPRRRPAGLDISEIKRVQLRPQNVALVAQCLDRPLLLAPSRGVLIHVLDRKGSVFRSLRQPRLKVVQPWKPATDNAAAFDPCAARSDLSKKVRSATTPRTPQTAASAPGSDTHFR